jgi:L-ascorbate metabolism protein UlaG (beta-lactamase superfamily)
MAEMLASRRIDVALLAVNGRDSRREQMGIVGNMEPHEAAILARSIRAGVAVPMHNDLFAVNRVEDQAVMQAWERHAKDVPLRFLKPGESLTTPCGCDGQGRGRG